MKATWIVESLKSSLHNEINHGTRLAGNVSDSHFSFCSTQDLSVHRHAILRLCSFYWHHIAIQLLFFYTLQTVRLEGKHTLTSFHTFGKFNRHCGGLSYSAKWPTAAIILWLKWKQKKVLILFQDRFHLLWQPSEQIFMWLSDTIFCKETKNISTRGSAWSRCCIACCKVKQLCR